MATYHRYGDGREREGIAKNIADAKPRHSACFWVNDLAGFANRGGGGDHPGKDRGVRVSRIRERNEKGQVSLVRRARLVV